MYPVSHGGDEPNMKGSMMATMRNYTYIAADFDHDKNAVDVLHWMKDKGFIHFMDAHEIQQSNDDSLPCSIKRSLRNRLENSYKFILIVGVHTNTVSKGGCQLCGSYNSYRQFCARGYTVDCRSFIKFECDKAVEDKLNIVVLYNSDTINRTLCPEAVRWRGTHQQMWRRGLDGKYYWDYDGIAQAIGD